MVLEKEHKTYQDKLPELLAHSGQFVLIRDGQIAGIYAAYEDAIKAGYEKFGLDPFMVKQIQAVERVQQFSRPMDACRT